MLSLDTELNWQTKFLTVMMMFAGSGIVTVLMALAYYLRDPSAQVFVSSLIPGIRELPIWFRILLGVPMVFMMLAGWSAVVVIGAIFYLSDFARVFLLIEMK
jgi:hypothetical protein